MLQVIKLKAFVPTVDAARAKAFYMDVIGLKLVSEDDFGIELEANGSALRIAKVPEFTPYPFTSLGWVVEDVAAEIVKLNEKGVVFERFGFFEQDDLGIWVAPGGTEVAWFKDPDGNLLSLND
jgi:catechol 2,3-dioxygenase-like lactoylglutathione lyase family enzyme